MCGREIKSCLSLLKDYIGRHQAEWDVYRVIGNPYDRVYTAPPHVPHENGTEYRVPASRAFYKLTEIIRSTPFLAAEVLRDRPLRCAYTGEAPGSFIEAVVSIRRRASIACVDSDSHFGISLKSDRRSVPHWKLGVGWMRANGVKICRGADGTGDLLRPNNVDSFVEACGGAGSCDIVTGDGGFDFSSDFNDQESQVLRLLAAECLVCLRLLAPGGVCVIKIFEAFGLETRNMIASFFGCFSDVDVLKPKTSRPGNSERYIVCGGFTGSEAGLYQAMVAAAAGNSSALSELVPDPACLSRLEEANVKYGLRQIESILGTVDCMDRKDASGVVDLSKDWMSEFLVH